jgi:hypothetical protein
VSPGDSITGFGPGKIDGAFHVADDVAASTKAGVGIMFTNAMAALNTNENGNDAPARPLPASIGDGQIIYPGVYSAAAALDINGDLVLDAEGVSESVFVFQVQSALGVTGRVLLQNGALASNVVWAVGTSATVAKLSAMAGIVIADQSITMDTGATLNGAALAKVAAVTLISNTISLEGQASDTLATCTACEDPFELSNGKCIESSGRARREQTLPTGCATNALVLAGSTVTNSGQTTVDSSLGVSPGSSITGFGPGTITGDFHTADVASNSAKAGVGLMFTDAMAAQNATPLAAGIGGGDTIVAGVYSAAAELEIIGDLVLDAEGDAGAVFIFQIQKELSLTGNVILHNGTLASNVIWAVGTSATITKNTAMAGIVIADQSITMAYGATLNGAALAKVAAVSLISNTVVLEGQASDTLATCTTCEDTYELHSGKCLLTVQ